MFWIRARSAAIFVPLVLIFAYLGGIWLDVFILVVMGIATWEYHRLLKTMGYFVSFPLLLVGVEGLILQRIVTGFVGSDIAIAVVLLAVTILGLTRYEHGDPQAMLSFALHFSGIMYLGWLGAYAISLTNIQPNGRWWFISTIVLVWLVDLGAYVVGSLSGRHKMTPRLSPKKSWEGFAGGILFGTGFGALLAIVLQPWFPELQILEGALLGLAIALVTPFGDVFISMIKRVAGVKDSGTLIPGHGGVLDRIDTWMWAGMVGFYMAQLFK